MVPIELLQDKRPVWDSIWWVWKQTFSFWKIFDV